MEVAGPLGTPLGLAQRKMASPRGEAGTSGFLSVSDSYHRVPAELGQESQASSCLRKGTPLASRVAQGVSGPSSSCVWNPRVFADDARGWQCPFLLCLHPQGCLRRGAGPRVLLKSGPGNRGRSACGPTHVARLEFPRETGLILRSSMVFPYRYTLTTPQGYIFPHLQNGANISIFFRDIIWTK